MPALRLILGDQLSDNITALQDVAADDTVLMAEVWDETRYVQHHQKKIAFIFAAMRHFAQRLSQRNIKVIYINLNSSQNQGSFTATLQALLPTLNVDRLIVTEPGEWRVLEMMQTWSKLLGLPVEIREDRRFICSRSQFSAWAKGRKQLRMEFFYRDMRKQTGLLMQDDQPCGGQWNFDAENRKVPKAGQSFPPPLTFSRDALTHEVLTLVKQHFSTHFGDLEPFNLAVTRSQALEALADFIENRLTYFGDFQDAMALDENLLFHSGLSPYLNCGLLEPLEVCQAAEQAYLLSLVPLNAAEGFIRQIIGWREYIRGVYWLKMPDYATLNYFEAKAALPAFYWTGKTKMRCLAHTIKVTAQEAQSHHIQRLMITGNFALLIGVLPQAVCEWYLAVYLDAYEWVELPNTLGMALFGDGGFLASKPYAASGAYINRMSNFCENCHYDVKAKLGKTACPFNYLYWDFFMRHHDRLKSNPRLGMAYRNLAKMDQQQKQAIQAQSEAFGRELDHLD